MSTFLNQIVINENSFEIILNSDFKSDNKLLIFNYKDVKDVNFIYPKWRKYSAIRSLGLLLFNFFLNTSEFSDSIKVKIEITKTNNENEIYDLLFHSINDIEKAETTLKSNLKIK